MRGGCCQQARGACSVRPACRRSTPASCCATPSVGRLNPSADYADRSLRCWTAQKRTKLHAGTRRRQVRGGNPHASPPTSRQPSSCRIPGTVIASINDIAAYRLATWLHSSVPTAIRTRIPTVADWQAQVKCQVACPVSTDAGRYVQLIAEGRDEDAYLVARAPN